MNEDNHSLDIYGKLFLLKFNKNSNKFYSAKC